MTASPTARHTDELTSAALRDLTALTHYLHQGDPDMPTTTLTRSYAFIGHLTGPVPCLISNFDQNLPWDTTRQQVLLERAHLDQLLEQVSHDNSRGTAVAVSDRVIVASEKSRIHGDTTQHHLPGGKTLLSFDARILSPITDPRWSAQSAWCQWVPVHTELVPYLDAFTAQFPNGAARLNLGYDACTTVQFDHAGIVWDAAVDARDGQDYHLWTTRPTADGDDDSIDTVFVLPGGAPFGPTDVAAWAKSTLARLT